MMTATGIAAQDRLEAEISRLKEENSRLLEQLTLRQRKHEGLGPPKDDFERGMDHGAYLVIAHILSVAVAARNNDDFWYLVYAMEDSYVRDPGLRYQDIAAENQRLHDALEDLQARQGLIDTSTRRQRPTAKRIRKHECKESDTARLQDLAQRHDLHFKRSGMIYRFEDYTAYGLDQALGYLEGFDRAMAASGSASSDV